MEDMFHIYQWHNKYYIIKNSRVADGVEPLKSDSANLEDEQNTASFHSYRHLQQEVITR